jgi:hypothetical protein
MQCRVAGLDFAGVSKDCIASIFKVMRKGPGDSSPIDDEGRTSRNISDRHSVTFQKTSDSKHSRCGK